MSASVTSGVTNLHLIWWPWLCRRYPPNWVRFKKKLWKSKHACLLNIQTKRILIDFSMNIFNVIELKHKIMLPKRDATDYATGRVYQWRSAKVQNLCLHALKVGSVNQHASFELDTDSSSFSHILEGTWLSFQSIFGGKALGSKICRRGKMNSCKRPLYDMQKHSEEVNVINLWSRSISDDFLTALNRGLPLVPTIHCKVFDVHVDIHTFFRNLRLK